MDTETGHVKSYSLPELEMLRKAGGTLVEVKEEDMTPKQKERFRKGEQPVVKLRDSKSRLGQMRVEYVKKQKSRNKRKAAKKAKQKQRRRK